MAIPTSFDRSLSGIDEAAGSILVALRVMNHAAPSDVPRLRAALRQRLQIYVDAAMALADESASR